MSSKDAWAWVGEQEFAAESQQARLRPERAKRHEDKFAEALPFEIVLGGKPIQLTPIEYRLVLFLSNRPYHAFTQREIFEGISPALTDQLAEEDITAHVRSLRDKLGFFRDFVQTVPYIGYRFKP